MTDQHPPIPPNCPYFEGNDFVDQNGARWNTDCLDLFDHYNTAMRPIIAAVAEVAWRKEAERLRAIRGCATSCIAMVKACDNADLWREWGQGKTKEAGK